MEINIIINYIILCTFSGWLLTNEVLRVDVPLIIRLTNCSATRLVVDRTEQNCLQSDSIVGLSDVVVVRVLTNVQEVSF